MSEHHTKRVIILGSTGSIGTQTIQVIATHNARWDAIDAAVDLLARDLSFLAANVMGRAMGTFANGAPGRGLFEQAHEDNPFTDATSSAPNDDGWLDFAGINDLGKKKALNLERSAYGADLATFDPLGLAYLRRRLLYDPSR